MAVTRQIISTFVKILSLFVSTQYVTASGVPVFIWSNEQYNLPSSYVGEVIPKTTFKANYVDHILKKNAHDVVVFLQDKLSLEDITQNADVYDSQGSGNVFKGLKSLVESHDSAQLPDVQGVTDVIGSIEKEFPGKVHELHAPFNLHSLPLSSRERNLILVHMPETGHDLSSFKKSLGKADEVITTVHSQLKELKKPFTALYTAKKPTHELTSGFYLGRHLLAEADEPNATFINFNDCIYFYAKAVTMEKSESKTLWHKWPLNNLKVNGTSEVTKGSFCNDTAARFVVNWKLSEEVKNNLTLFIMDMSLSCKPGGYWRITDFVFSYKYMNHTGGSETGHNDTLMQADFIKAPRQFSYHCTDTKPIKQTNTSGEDILQIKLEGFQMQFGNLTGKFGQSDDCVGVFTIPILSGILVTLLLLAILAYGISMMANITTMDRFDDPKGKTITVNVSEQ